MIGRINFAKIIKDHLASLRSLNNAKPSIYWGDIMLFFIFPLVSSVLLVHFDISIKSLVGELIKAIAIFAAFLFNMLAIIYNSMNQLEKDSEGSSLKKTYVKEIHSNLSFNILVGILLIFVLLIYFVLEQKIAVTFLVKLFSGVSFFLIILFFLTLLMNLNRVNILLNRQIKDKITKR